MRDLLGDLPIAEESIALGGRTITNELDISLEMDPIVTPLVDKETEHKSANWFGHYSE